MNPSKVLHLLSWCPGTSFKKQLAMARVFCTQHLERPFKYSLQRVVVVISITYLVHTLNDFICQVGGSVAPSMVYDALRHMEEKGISPEESWMEALKEASGAAFLGTLFICLVGHSTHVCCPTC